MEKEDNIAFPILKRKVLWRLECYNRKMLSVAKDHDKDGSDVAFCPKQDGNELENVEIKRNCLESQCFTMINRKRMLDCLKKICTWN